MNVQGTIAYREPVRLTVDAFLLLSTRGCLSAFSKSELLDGEIFGVPVDSKSDGSVPVKLRIQAYRLLAEADLLGSEDRSELVDGDIFLMSPQHRPHGFVKDEIAYRLRRALENAGNSLHVATEQSVEIPPHSEPQPDLILTSEPRGAGAIPVASVALLAEISANTLDFDLVDKALVYARAGVPEYWVVDVAGRCVHQMWDPKYGSYLQKRVLGFGEVLVAITIAGLDISTADL
ncbi:Uma2 family endonuclease [Sphingomonas sp. CA1-15]|uniref:Uma2 family endonuclease n=2 Tax=Sphingomonas immobilis TaxID=3063997 RepID=A0ABT9A3I7_9SPHN|nr:Uma2 family endonuclease [Sphingomonas sp. CA1-15]